MEIILTLAQWENLKQIVTLGQKAERTLAKPIEVTNSQLSIEIESDGVAITLAD